MADYNQYAELGTSGLRRDKRYVWEEWQKELVGPKGRAIYREMATSDPLIQAALLTIGQWLVRVPWHVEPGSDTPRGREDAEFVESLMDDMEHPWSAFVSEALDLLIYGFSLFEVVWKLRAGPDNPDPSRRSRHSDGRIGWRKFAVRAQESIDGWEWDPDTGELLGAWQQTYPRFERVFIPLDRALLFRTTHRKGNPEGVSILRGAYRPWFYRKRIQEIEAIGVERNLAGLPKMMVPSEWFTDAAYEAQFDYSKKMVSTVRANEQGGVLLPSIYDENSNKLVEFELLSSPARRTLDTQAVISTYATEMLMALLADALLLGHEQVGTQALARERYDMTTASFEGWLDEIEDQLNRHELPRLFRVNGMSTVDMPRIVHAPVTKTNLQELSTAIKNLADSGMELFPGSMDSFVREVAGWPEQTVEDEQPPALDPEVVEKAAPGVAPVAERNSVEGLRRLWFRKYRRPTRLKLEHPSFE